MLSTKDYIEFWDEDRYCKMITTFLLPLSESLFPYIDALLLLRVGKSSGSLIRSSRLVVANGLWSVRMTANSFPQLRAYM